MTQWLLPILVTLASSAVLQATVTAFFDRKKKAADASDILARSAIEQVTAMQTELTDARADMRNFRSALYEHQKWDAMVYKRLAELDQAVPAPPELWV